MGQDPQEIIFYYKNNYLIIELYDLRHLRKDEKNELQKIFEELFSDDEIRGVRILIIAHCLGLIITNYTVSAEIENLMIIGNICGVPSNLTTSLKRIVIYLTKQIKNIFLEEDEENEPINFEQFDIEKLIEEINEDI